jgi:hypothetical protein
MIAEYEIVPFCPNTPGSDEEEVHEKWQPNLLSLGGKHLTNTVLHIPLNSQ